MLERGMVIRGGTIVTARGMKEADIWILQGKIVRIAKDTLTKNPFNDLFEEIDATGMYLLPGFVALLTHSLYKIKDVDVYIAAMRNLISTGCTSLVDVFRPERWMSRPQIHYQQTQHFNSLLDYVWHVEIDVADLHGDRLGEWMNHGYSSFHVTIRNPEEISTIKWETLLQLHTSKHTILHMQVQNDPFLKKEQRELIRKSWLEATRYWRLRTVITDSQAAFHSEENDPYLHIFRLPAEVTDQGLRQLHRQWFGSWQVASPIHDVRIDTRKSWCTPEELLCLLVRLASTNVAKAVGLYPRKGSLTTGADADIVFLKKENWLTKNDLSTILNFSEMHLPTSVMSNGKWIYRNMRFIPLIGMGKCLFDTKPYAYVI
ncbi:amidohydrolase family protein [Brevibacillus sp. MER 51]|uniref:amidohydrolase family protein n=1 Tax=Brevibacillus sp. MER 51 TaxID=2939560 RepID=UPI002040C5D3|nr:amidohydrolase family protein [Brevibacillus sp. MER 51]MCM3142454.1 amidohydrolase family protein [Brevibacillus sp. MER 51]